MRRFHGIPVFVAVLALILVPVTAHGQTLGAVLTGAAEVPVNENQGFGNATVTFNATRTSITVTITVSNLGSPINNFHIHQGAAGTTGPVVVDLIGLGGTFVNGTMTGTFPIPPAISNQILLNPANFYINVHTTALPGGAVRGALAYVSGDAVTYAVQLHPANEVPPVNSHAFGSAFVTFNPFNNNIAFEVHASGIASPTMAHIHRGAAGVNGPVIINFATSSGQIAGGRASGVGSITTFQSANLLPTDLIALSNAPSAAGYYVNVHSTAFPGGEIRGQLVPANEYDIPIAGRVTNGRGQTFVTDVRVFNPSYTDVTTALLEYFPSSLEANAAAAESMVVHIAPRATAVLDDVAGPAHLDVAGTTGALRVTSATPIAVTSRIYSDLRAENKGTLGQFVPAFARQAGLRRGVMPHLLSEGFRTNVGFFNPTLTDSTIRLELHDSNGALIGQQILQLAALSQQQRSLGTYFPDTDLDAAANATLSFDSSAPIFAYAAVNDNTSGDSMLIPAQFDPGVSAGQ